MRVTEEELRRLLKTHGWNLIQRQRGRKSYLYAQKWVKGEVYLTSVANLPLLTQETVLMKIGRVSGE